MEITEDDYQFNSLIHDVLSIIEFRMKNRSVKLIYDISPDIPRVLVGDEVRIRQILINLLNNAVNFTHKGHIKLKIFWEPDLDSNGYLHVSVEDTGIGISQRDMNKLFTAFGQIDTKKNRNVEGTGLGLIITKRLLNLMGGDITVRSKVGEGSTFSFVLHQKAEAFVGAFVLFHCRLPRFANIIYHYTLIVKLFQSTRDCAIIYSV